MNYEQDLPLRKETAYSPGIESGKRAKREKSRNEIRKRKEKMIK